MRACLAAAALSALIAPSALAAGSAAAPDWSEAAGRARSLSFSYPASARLEGAWAQRRAAEAAASQPMAPVALAPPPSAGAEAAPLDFGSMIIGSALWRPARVSGPV